ncbi:MAG: SPFH domain-containing protein [Spirochaetales bacterium]|nr:SPFH domain-containing protein [Spirochaetales bacterium]
MFGIRYIKFDSMNHVILYKKGKIRKKGRGLAFYYYAPSSSIVAIPMGSKDIPFIFNNSTADYQSISIQGQITYKIEDPGKLAEFLDFTVTQQGDYKTEDPQKLDQRLINEAQTATSSFIQKLALKDALRKAKEIETQISEGLKTSNAVRILGIVPISVNVVAVKPSPEMAKALETTTREALQQEADQAIYTRRNFAVEQEKKIKESELDTEIAVEEKKKQIAEKKAESEVLAEENKRKIREMKMEADIAVEKQKKDLITMQSENMRKEADAKGYAINTTLTPYKGIDWKILMMLQREGNDPKSNIAVAFRELAEKAQNINNLNITPDLLQSLTQQAYPQK